MRERRPAESGARSDEYWNAGEEQQEEHIDDEADKDETETKFHCYPGGVDRYILGKIRRHDAQLRNET